MLSIEVVTKTWDSDDYEDLTRHFLKMSKDTFLLGTVRFVIIFFLTTTQIIDCSYSLESFHFLTPRSENPS